MKVYEKFGKIDENQERQDKKAKELVKQLTQFVPVALNYGAMEKKFSSSE